MVDRAVEGVRHWKQGDRSHLSALSGDEMLNVYVCLHLLCEVEQQDAEEAAAKNVGRRYLHTPMRGILNRYHHADEEFADVAIEYFTLTAPPRFRRAAAPPTSDGKPSWFRQGW